MKIALNLVLIADSESTQKSVQTRTGIIDLGAFCVELWPKQVSYRISVPMSYISCSRLIISMFHKSHWFVCFCLFYSFSATVKMVVYKNANNKRRAAIWQRLFGLVLGQSIKKAHGIKFNNFSLLAQIEFNISAHQLNFNIF